MLTKKIDFLLSGEFTHDPSEINFSGLAAELALKANPGQIFNQPFDSDTGFSYDSALIEFVAGSLQQKDQRPSDATFGATFTSAIDISLVETATTGKKYLFSCKYIDSDGVAKTKNIGRAAVPNQESVDLSTLTFTT